MTSFRFVLLVACVLALVVGCNRKSKTNPEGTMSLADARKGFTTKLKKNYNAKEEVPEPPAKIFRKVQYESPAGKLAAYVSPDPKDDKKHPAIIWITGGDCNTIGDVWGAAKPGNDQSARQYREAGIVMMFPSLRGGNENPGSEENFYGEVDDVLAAADYLAKLDYVDPTRIYLGGHSTGGTLALLVAESTDRFRAVFAFGPVDDVSGYGSKDLTFDLKNPREVQLRSPIHWLDSIHSPVFVFEGSSQGNGEALQTLKN